MLGSPIGARSGLAPCRYAPPVTTELGDTILWQTAGVANDGFEHLAESTPSLPGSFDRGSERIDFAPVFVAICIAPAEYESTRARVFELS